MPLSFSCLAGYTRAMESRFPMRINKYLAMQGYSTRKDADRLVEKGLVLINGRRAVLGQKVDEGARVEVSYKPRKFKYLAYNKPAGVVTHTPQFGEKDVAREVGIPDLFPVGRLDKRSHGLIILTDDARITDKLLNPEYAHEKEYIVRTVEELPSNFKQRMEAGVDIEGYVTKKCEVELHGPKTFLIRLTEGKKHQIRRMCAALKVTIQDLERVRVMNIRLGNLKPGQHREIEGRELAEFLKALGMSR